jgi:hypothetical protein
LPGGDTKYFIIDERRRFPTALNKYNDKQLQTVESSDITISELMLPSH